MGRLGERLLGASYGVVRLLIALAALAVVALILFGLLETRSLRGSQPNLDPIAAPEAPPLPKPEKAASTPLPPFVPKGTTPFVRRLEAGSELKRLRLDIKEVSRAEAAIEARLERIRPFLLLGDGSFRSPDWATRSESTYITLLYRLTDPARDLESFTLAGAAADDPLGGRLRVRAWTLGAPYEENELAAASATLDHIVRCVGWEMEGGVDVLLTPQLGYDVFRYQPRPPIRRAAGIYFQTDSYCVVDSDLPPWFRVEVVEHELIHAYCRRVSRSHWKSRLITEGIAEYLRLLEPGDYGLNVPRERLASHLAALRVTLERLARSGVNLKTVQPARLVSLDPDAFYRLGHVGYLLGLATIAFVGGDVVQKALYRGAEAPIADAVGGIEWQEFLVFVSQGGRYGKPQRAVLVEDSAAASREEPRIDRAGLADVLSRIGAEVADPDKLPDVELSPADLAATLGGDLRMGLALRLLFAEPLEVRVFADVSVAMDREVRLMPLAGTPFEMLGTMQEGLMARQLATRVADLFGAGPAGHVVALGTPPRTGNTDVLDPVKPLAFDGYLDCPREERRLSVLILGSPGLAALVPEEIPDGLKPAEVLLVIDLTQDGEAVWWAHALDKPQRHVAYWSPLAEEAPR